MRRLSVNLMTRLALALALVGLLPLGLAAWRLTGLNREALQNQVLQAHVLAAATAAKRVEDYLALRRALGSFLASNVAQTAASGSAGMSDLLYASLEARPDLDAAVVLNEQGALVIRAQRVQADEEMERLLAASGEAPFVSPAGSAAGPRWVRLDAPLPEAGGGIRLLWKGAPLERILDPYALGAQARLSLLDRQGVRLAGSPLLPTDTPPALLEQIGTGVFSGAQLWRAPGREEILAAFDAVEGTSWVVLSLQPAAVAEAVARRMRRESQLAMILALGLIGGLAALAWVSVVRPMRDLARVQRRLAGLQGTPTGGSEIDQLKSSFAALERSLRERAEVEEVFLGRYLVVGVLGEGAMGTVFRGWDPKLRRPLALKTIHLGRTMGDAQRAEQAARLLSEAVTVAKFNHPNIVSIYDAEETGEAAFIAMELIEGSTLEQYLWAEKVMPPGQAAYVGAAIARALAEAHGRGVLHHDVKPANVLLSREGAVKVTDFGISQVLTDLSKEGSVYGTPGYLPPETLELQVYDRRGDLFGLGAVIYHGLTGKRPFQGKTYREVLVRTLEGKVVPPRDLVPEIPEEMSRLVMELLARDPNRRPAGAAEVARRLESLAETLAPGWRPSFNDEIQPTPPVRGRAAPPPPASRLVHSPDRRPDSLRRRGGS